MKTRAVKILFFNRGNRSINLFNRMLLVDTVKYRSSLPRVVQIAETN